MISGRWAIEINDQQETSFKLADDSIVSPEIRFGYDTIYMEVRVDGKHTKSDCIGIYAIEDNTIRITDRMGEQKICKYFLKDNILTITENDNPNQIIMRLRKIEEDD